MTKKTHSPKSENRSDPPTGGGFGQTGPTAHPSSDATAEKPDQAALDDALWETFPASDPISPGDEATHHASDTTSDATEQGNASPPPSSTEPFEFPTRESMASGERDDENRKSGE